MKLADEGLGTWLEESRVLPRFIQDGFIVKANTLISSYLLF